MSSSRPNFFSMQSVAVALVIAGGTIACGSKGVGAGLQDGGLGGAGDDAGGLGPDPYADVYIPPPVGNQLQTGDNLSVRGVTGDGHVIYSDDVALALYAIPLAGGAAEHLASLGAKFQVNIYGNVVFAWSNVNAANVGALTVWSAATGSHAISSASFAITANASPSGGDILYVDNVDAQAVAGDVYVAHADGTSKVKLASKAQIQTAFPNLAFAGPYAVVSYLPSGAGNSATIASFLAPGWTPISLATAASATSSFWVDAAGTKVLYSGVSGGVSVVPVGGGAPTLIDASGHSGFLTADGQSAIYDTQSHLLRRSSMSTLSSVTLVPGDFLGWEGLSNDQQWLVYYAHYNAGAITDLFLTSTKTPGIQYTLSAAQVAVLAGDAFTADSTHALFATGVSPSTGTGTLNAFSIADNSSVALGQSVWRDLAATAAKVVFIDRYWPTGGLRFGHGDIESVDTAQGAPPTRVVTRADAVFALSPAGDKIVYAFSVQPGALAGIWVTDVP